MNWMKKARKRIIIVRCKQQRTQDQIPASKLFELWMKQQPLQLYMPWIRKVNKRTCWVLTWVAKMSIIEWWNISALISSVFTETMCWKINRHSGVFVSHMSELSVLYHYHLQAFWPHSNQIRKQSSTCQRIHSMREIHRSTVTISSCSNFLCRK